MNLPKDLMSGEPGERSEITNNNYTMIENVKRLLSRVTMSCFGTDFKMRIEHDNEFDNGRIFIQVVYDAPCTKTGEVQEWHGRKWYLSKHMTEDEIIKTAYVAFEAAVKHEIMEGFKVAGTVLFNPHVHYEALLAVSHNEIKRSLS